MKHHTASTVLALADHMPEVQRYISRWRDRAELSWEDALLASLGALEATYSDLRVIAAKKQHNVPPLVVPQFPANPAELSALERQNRMITAVCSAAEQVFWLQTLLINIENSIVAVPKIDLADVLHHADQPSSSGT